ncbi:hypothetical protein D9M68_17810 [compost metagenome]
MKGQLLITVAVTLASAVAVDLYNTSKFRARLIAKREVKAMQEASNVYNAAK